MANAEAQNGELIEKLITVNRVAKLLKVVVSLASPH